MNKKIIYSLFFSLCVCTGLFAQNNHSVIDAKRLNPTTVELRLSDNSSMLFDFYGNHIFRIFCDKKGGEMRDPQAEPPAQILVDNPRKNPRNVSVKQTDESVIITTQDIAITIDKRALRMKVTNLKTGKVALESVEPFEFTPKSVSWKLKTDDSEYFYGGGVQNGRFSHKGKAIAIENQNSWTDGGVASPNPFYWSTNGYGIMFYTFKKGTYDFGAKEKNIVVLSHDTDYLDLFVMINDGAVNLLNDFYQLTGNPVLLPKFGFYQGHLNAYNRDYWKENENGILFEDGKRYKESQKDNGGIKESLNGELENNYQFSARAVIDRYKAHDMPFGWLLPNDGYGAGYGQTETLDGNVANLKSLRDYANNHGVQIGLWTQSDLHPKEGVSALLQRDIVKEVRDAGVRVLKTDVAWVGAGYSFGLNGVADVAEIMPRYGNNARPFIISLDGWSGTQRYAGIWTGDQTGGVWEYIRFHIPTYIGSGLSGNPNISSDMDGIFGGKNAVINIRDFQWKTFTPMQLNMDGWGANPKYPHIFGEPTTSINRMYLKLKSELMPYTYSIARESVDGMPMIRAMFLEYPSDYTHGKSTQYQFLYGSDFLVAPIYQNTQADTLGNDVRNGIYLPAGTWFDYFSGDKYEGNRIINNFDAPIWKLPVFVKAGAIIPMTNPNNNVSEIDKNLRIYEFYPHGKNSFKEYDDDGYTEAYRGGESVTTEIVSELDAKKNFTVTIHPTKGNFDGFVKDKRTVLKINVSKKPSKVVAKQNNKTTRLREVQSIDAFNNADNVYFYNNRVNLNRFATKGSSFENVDIKKNPQLWIKIGATDITKHTLTVLASDVELNPKEHLLAHTGKLLSPKNVHVSDSNRTAYTLCPVWQPVANADYYEIDFDGMRYSTIRDTRLLFEDLKPETDYTFKLRAVNKSGFSDWTQFAAQTKSNPLEFAIKGITATTTCKNQGGQGIANLFDFDEASMWHTDWNEKAVPFDIIIDLNTVNQLDKMHYLPRTSGLNGVLYGGTIFYGNDKNNWTKAGDFAWERDNNTKVFRFGNNPTARYIKISVTRGVGSFGSGRELYIFKMPGTESYLPGDINHDRLIDMNDFTSYLNYTGLRQGDADFEGYVSKGDLNQNGLIDAYDISAVATRLHGGATIKKEDAPVAGKLSFESDKKSYKSGEIVRLTVRGNELQSVNALSFALTYDARKYEFVAVEPLAVKGMENMTNDRLHTNGTKALYPTFVNVGEQPMLNGNADLCVIKMKAKQNLVFDLQPTDIILVDKKMNSVVE